MVAAIELIKSIKGPSVVDPDHKALRVGQPARPTEPLGVLLRCGLECWQEAARRPNGRSDTKAHEVKAYAKEAGPQAGLITWYCCRGNARADEPVGRAAVAAQLPEALSRTSRPTRCWPRTCWRVSFAVLPH